MSPTIEIFRDLQKQAAELCTDCLRDHIEDNIAILGDLSDTAQNLDAIQHTSPENEELFLKAHSEFTAVLMTIATFTAGLVKRPAPVASLTLSNN